MLIFYNLFSSILGPRNHFWDFTLKISKIFTKIFISTYKQKAFYKTLFLLGPFLGSKMLLINPILGRGGHYGPDDRERPRCFHRLRAMTIEIHDFVSAYV